MKKMIKELTPYIFLLVAMLCFVGFIITAPPMPKKAPPVRAYLFCYNIPLAQGGVLMGYSTRKVDGALTVKGLVYTAALIKEELVNEKPERELVGNVIFTSVQEIGK